MKYLMVGGNFDDADGRPSGFINKLFSAMKTVNNEGTLINGGNFSVLFSTLTSTVEQTDVLFWFANVPNDKEKLVEGIKIKYPKIILVTSKRNNNEYNWLEVISRALKVKANLIVNFERDVEGTIISTVLDPLGNQFCATATVEKLALILLTRTGQLTKYTRNSSKSIDPQPLEVPNKEEFFALARKYGDRFHDLVHVHDTTRFLGNVSFRCESGFPSFRGDKDIIYVTRRNVDKRNISREGFVATKLMGEAVGYYGEIKPSVDTPIQLRLYRHFKDINYMIHSHVYIAGAPFTKSVIPCGAIEEFHEIVDLIEAYDHAPKSTFFINLRGHGSLIMSPDISPMRAIFIARPIPENVA